MRQSLKSQFGRNLRSAAFFMPIYFFSAIYGGNYRGVRRFFIMIFNYKSCNFSSALDISLKCLSLVLTLQLCFIARYEMIAS